MQFSYNSISFGHDTRNNRSTITRYIDLLNSSSDKSSTLANLVWHAHTHTHTRRSDKLYYALRRMHEDANKNINFSGSLVKRAGLQLAVSPVAICIRGRCTSVSNTREHIGSTCMLVSSNTCSLLDVSAASVNNLLCSFYYCNRRAYFYALLSGRQGF